MPAAKHPKIRSPELIPDLLAAEPTVRVDLAALRQTLVFAFAMGGSVEQFEKILGAASLPPSAWDRSYFARDLFLEQLLDQCLRVRIGGRAQRTSVGYLLRVIAEPPRDPAIVAFRRRVLEELAESSELRSELEGAYADIVDLRGLLCAGRFTSEGLRRLEILRSVKKVFDGLAGSFESASSGLSRVRAFGIAVRESQAYRRLEALLDHEDHLGTVDLRVRVGSDGELRTFQIVSVRENSKNPFYSSPIGRFFARIMLLFRGYRMNGGEVVERLYDDIFTSLEEQIALLFQLVGDMEFYLAGLSFRDLAHSKGLAVCFPEIVESAPAKGEGSEGSAGGEGGEGGRGMTFRGLWNPLLLSEKDKAAPVPSDLRVTRVGSVVMVTGPNSGGKTRLLQAIALAQVLGESGLFVAAREARIPRVSGLFVSLLEEARADQPEGQLGMELMRIRRMFEQLGVGSLVLLDELCSGTNPSEGEEIARLVISLLPELGAQAFVSTHLLQFAERLAEERPIEGLAFLQVELDEHDRPTYGFVSGVAKTSLAHKTAARLGVTRDELLDLIAQKKRAAAREERGESNIKSKEPSAMKRRPSAIARGAQS